MARGEDSGLLGRRLNRNAHQEPLFIQRAHHPYRNAPSPIGARLRIVNAHRLEVRKLAPLRSVVRMRDVVDDLGTFARKKAPSRHGCSSPLSRFVLGLAGGHRQESVAYRPPGGKFGSLFVSIEKTLPSFDRGFQSPHNEMP